MPVPVSATSYVESAGERTVQSVHVAAALPPRKRGDLPTGAGWPAAGARRPVRDLLVPVSVVDYALLVVRPACFARAESRSSLVLTHCLHAFA